MSVLRRHPLPATILVAGLLCAWLGALAHHDVSGEGSHPCPACVAGHAAGAVADAPDLPEPTAVAAAVPQVIESARGRALASARQRGPPVVNR